jgi:hypothetical protein
MKLLHAACLLSMCIIAETLASNSPNMPSPLQLEMTPEPHTCNIAACMEKIRITYGQGVASIPRINTAKTCVACCWSIAIIPCIGIGLLQDLTCGIFCGKSPRSSQPYDDELLVCADACPSYCMPNTRHNLNTLIQIKPRIME